MKFIQLFRYLDRIIIIPNEFTFKLYVLLYYLKKMKNY
jgi:hypothetical protein